MVTPGSTFPDRAKITPHEIAHRTCLALSRTIPPAMVGVTVIYIINIQFLSGG